jgi:hypothetical protein
MPGAGFKKTAKIYYDLMPTLINAPIDFVKGEMVRYHHISVLDFSDDFSVSRNHSVNTNRSLLIVTSDYKTMGSSMKKRTLSQRI